MLKGYTYEPRYVCDVCGQRFEYKLRFHTTKRSVNDRLGNRLINVPCNGVLRRIDI